MTSKSSLFTPLMLSLVIVAADDDIAFAQTDVAAYDTPVLESNTTDGSDIAFGYHAAKSRAILIKDAAGKVVGPYLYATNPYVNSINALVDNVFVRAGTHSFALHLTQSTLGQPDKAVVYFSTASCTGTAYLIYYQLDMTVVPFAAVVGTTAYVGGAALAEINTPANSRRYFNGARVICEPSVGGSFFGNFVPVVFTFNMSELNFTPPFSVH